MTRTIFLVIGAAHGGTTISVMLLRQHPEVFATGELTDFPNGGQFLSENRCSCGVLASECSFWQDIESETRNTEGRSERSILNIYRSVFRRSGADAIVDCNHGTKRVAQLSREVASASDLRLIVIHVSRPAEAVANSQLRVALERNRIVDRFMARSRTVIRAVVGRRRIMSKLGRSDVGFPVVSVDYARLCENPLEVLEPIWKMAGLDTDDAANWLRDRPRVVHKPAHMIRGNRKLRGLSHIELRQDLSTSMLTSWERFLVRLMDNYAAERTVTAMMGIARPLRRIVRPEQ